MEPVLTEAPYRVVELMVRDAGRHTPVNVTIDGKKKIAMIKSVDRAPASARIRHVSLHAVKASERVVAEVPIHLIGLGESPAERAGLVILQAIEEIEVKAKPADLPDALTINVGGLETHEDKLTLADITLPAGVEFADVELDTELVVANVYEPAALQAANNAVGGDATEDVVEETESETTADTATVKAEE
jgi:large subunit ribosomal protein L25